MQGGTPIVLIINEWIAIIFCFGCRTFWSQIILLPILSIQIAITHIKTKNLHGKSFLIEGKNYETPNQFHYYQINYNISYVCLTAKKKPLLLLFYFFCSRIHSLYISRLKKNLLIFSLLTHTHTNYLSRSKQHFALAFLTFFSSSFSFPRSPPWLFSRRWQQFALSFLAFFSLSFSFSRSSHWLSSRRRQHFALSSLAFFSSSLSFHMVFFGYLFVALFLYKTLFLFSLKLRIHYFFNRD